MGLEGELPPLPVGASTDEKKHQYEKVTLRISQLLEGEDDWVAAMATVVCELHHAFEYFHWTGFYQASSVHHRMLVIGPYQGHLGCLRIPFARGVCGAAAREQKTQLVPDVTKFEGYIACASSTQSEVVVPVVCRRNALLLAVLDVDSDHPDAFDEVDAHCLETICAYLGSQYGSPVPPTSHGQQLHQSHHSVHHAH